MSNQVNFPLETKKIEKGNLSQATAGHGESSVISISKYSRSLGV